jgi:hypothetical protein
MFRPEKISYISSSGLLDALLSRGSRFSSVPKRLLSRSNSLRSSLCGEILLIHVDVDHLVKVAGIAGM